eukprot:Tbor_TRINITY_DN5243_c0_g1::TRINITY_DN5243_c0_g1_i1::g.16784::m.16784
MQREVSQVALRYIIPCLHYVLFGVGIALYLVLPLMGTQPIVHDESNLRTRVAQSVIVADDIKYGMDADIAMHKKRSKAPLETQSNTTEGKFVVAGKRASGSDSFLFINAGASRAAVLALARALKRAPFLSMDIHFYFVNSLEEASRIEIPQGLIRGAILLDFPTPAVNWVHVHTFGKDGLQSNQDAVNVVVSAFFMSDIGIKMTRTFDAAGLSETQKQLNGQILNFISEYVGPLANHLKPLLPVLKGPFPYSPQDVTSHFTDYILSMVQSDVTGPYGGGTLRSVKGLCIVGISANKERHLGNDYTSLNSVVASLEQTIRGFNNLNERLHHSYPVWVSVSPSYFVDYAMLQSIPFVQMGCGVVCLLNYIAITTNMKTKNNSRDDGQKLGVGAFLVILISGVLAMTTSIINSEVKMPDMMKHLLRSLDERKGEVIQSYTDISDIRTLSLSYIVASFPGIFIVLRGLFMVWGSNTLLGGFLPSTKSIIIALYIWTLGWMALFIALHPGLSLVGDASLAFQLLIIGVMYHPKMDFCSRLHCQQDSKSRLLTTSLRMLHFIVSLTIRVLCCLASTGLVVIWDGLLGGSPSPSSIPLSSFLVTTVMIWSVSIAKLFT